MSTFKSGSNGNVSNVGSDKRMDARSISEAFETVFAAESRKYAISTGAVAVTADSAIAILTNNNEDNLVVSSNALILFDISGPATSSGSVLVESNATENTGTFSDFSTPFNFNLGAARPADLTARKGSSGATFTGSTQQISGFFEDPVNIVSNTEKFIIAQGNNIAISIVLPTGVTAANVVWMANLYFDNSPSIREL